MASTAISSIRSERDELREKAVRLRARADDAEAKAEALDAALDVIRGRMNGARAKKKKTARGRGPNRRPTVTRDELARQIEEIMRREPNREWTCPAIVKAVDRAHSSVQVAVEHLLAGRRVTLVRRGPKGGPVVRYRETTVKPGEGVK